MTRPALTVWIIGLAGAGKTTIGRELTMRLRQRREATVMVDGDVFRTIMGEDLGHSLAERERNGWRIARLCAWLNEQGIDVVCGILSLFPEQRAWNREHLARYLEVFVDVPIAELERRDQKGLYSGARSGQLHNVAGVDLHFEPPQADLVLTNIGPREACGELATDIVRALEQRGWLS